MSTASSETVKGNCKTSAKGKGKGPPPGRGKEPVREPIRPPVQKPQAEDAIGAVATLQLPDGSWSLAEGSLASALGIYPSGFEDMCTKLALPVDVDLSCIVATSAARQAIERCVTIVASKLQTGDPRAKRAQALSLAEAKSILGDRVLDSATKWLEQAWSSVAARCPEETRMLQVKLEGLISRMLDVQLPRPNWKTALADNVNKRLTCQQCNRQFSAAVGKCPLCKPVDEPQAPALKRRQSGEELMQWRLLPAAPVDVAALQFGQTKSILHLAGGSGGVTLLHLPEGVIAIKPMMMNSVSEFVAVQLADFVGIQVAKLNVARYGEDAFFQIKQAIREAPADIDEHRDIARRTMSRAEFLGILEFVAGCSVQGLQAHALLKNMSEGARSDFWRSVGVLVAFDVLINNVDRVPLLWDNEGNTGNLMLMLDEQNESALPSVVGIDQAVAAVVDGFVPGRQRYLDRVSKVTVATFCGSWEVDALSPLRVAANEAAHKAAADRAAAENLAAQKLAELAAVEQAAAKEAAVASLIKALAGDDLSTLADAINEAWLQWLDTQEEEGELARRVAAADEAAAELAAAERAAAEKAAAANLNNALFGEDQSALWTAIGEANALSVDTKAAEEEFARRDLAEADRKAAAEEVSAESGADGAENVSSTGKGKSNGPPLPKGKGKGPLLPQGKVPLLPKGKGAPTKRKGQHLTAYLTAIAAGNSAKGLLLQQQKGRLSKGAGRKGQSKCTKAESVPKQARSPPPAPRWSPSMGLKRVQEAFEVNCSTQVDAHAFLAGLRDGFTCIADQWEDGSMPKFLADTVASATRTFEHASVDVGLNNVGAMCDFVSAVAAVIAEGRSTSALSVQ